MDTDSGATTNTTCTNGGKDKHNYYNYNLSIPSGATINGIQVRLDAKADATSGAPKLCVALSWDGGTTWTTTQSTATLTAAASEATYTLGSSSDTWGRTWASGDFSNTNFRVRVYNVASDITRDFSLDWAAVQVHYTASGSADTQFHYNGDGNLVKKVKPDGTTTVYIAGVYEVETSGATTKKTTYYPAGGAMRVEVVGVSNDVYYVVGDHLGSASVTLNSDGETRTDGEQRFYPFGESRITSAALPTDKLFTGQMALPELGGIYHYNARAFSPKLGRFLSADTIVPSPANPQTYNRYSYVNNNPINATDPTGHETCYDTGVEIGSGISQADCWAYGRDKWQLGMSVAAPVAGGGYNTDSALILAYLSGSAGGRPNRQAGGFTEAEWIKRGVRFTGNWTGIQRQGAVDALNAVMGLFGADFIDGALGLQDGLELRGNTENNRTYPFGNLIEIITSSRGVSYSADQIMHFMIHELGHVVSWTAGGCSRTFVKGGCSGYEGGEWNRLAPGWVNDGTGWSFTGKPGDTASCYASGICSGGFTPSPEEDFAETFTWMVYTWVLDTNLAGYRQPSQGRLVAVSRAIIFLKTCNSSACK